MQAALKEIKNSNSLAIDIENGILANPETGDIVQGTGGVRKFRIADPARQKGSRGGYRVFFIDLPHVERTHLLFILQKGESEDLTVDEKKAIKNIVLKLKKESKP